MHELKMTETQTQNIHVWISAERFDRFAASSAVNSKCQIQSL